MAETTKIAWCDHTFSPWHGCQKVSPGCANCYAEPLAARYGRDVWGPSRPRHLVAQSTWMTPYSWDRRARADGVRRRVFCGSMCDVFEDRVELIGARCRLLELIKHTPNLDWLLLTKRPENVRKFCHESPWSWVETPPPNVWLGVSVEDQQRADERIPLLLQTPAAVRFLSCEPLLGPVDLRPKAPDRYADLDRRYGRHVDPSRFPPAGDRVLNCFPAVGWVIVGGESGPNARPCRVEWVRSLVRQCKAAGVACFTKQLGANVSTTLPDWECWPGHCGPLSPVQFQGDGFGNYHVSGLRDPKGGDMAEWPADLRVREMPGEVAR